MKKMNNLLGVTLGDPLPVVFDRWQREIIVYPALLRFDNEPEQEGWAVFVSGLCHRSGTWWFVSSSEAPTAIDAVQALERRYT